jgi:hypothetical protein
MLLFCIHGQDNLSTNLVLILRQQAVLIPSFFSSYCKGQEAAVYCKAMKVATFQHLRARNVGLLGEYLFASSHTFSDFGLGRVVKPK